MARPDSKPLTLEACAEYMAEYARGQRAREQTYNEGQAAIRALRSEVEAVSAWLKDAALRSEGAGLWAPGLEMRNCAGRLDKALGVETPKKD